MEDQKKAIRKEIRKKEKDLTAKYKDMSNQKIFDSVIRLQEFQKAHTVFCFISMPNEVDTHAIIETCWKYGKTVCVPRCEDRGIMYAYRIDSWSDVKAGTWNILEPVKGCIQMDPKDIDFAIIPCCTATTDGRRLGFGGGFYDRYLLKTNCTKAVLCRSALLCEELPMEAYDQYMDIVISDDGVYYGT